FSFQIIGKIYYAIVREKISTILQRLCIFTILSSVD
ncbi:unnamed protein product, partial [Brassica rapa subsp. trilocularis]